jgi:hypothetical protein
MLRIYSPWDGCLRVLPGVPVLQVRDNLGALAARFAALQVDGGSAFLSRAAGRFRKPLVTKSVVQYRYRGLAGSSEGGGGVGRAKGVGTREQEGGDGGGGRSGGDWVGRKRQSGHMTEVTCQM